MAEPAPFGAEWGLRKRRLSAHLAVIVMLLSRLALRASELVLLGDAIQKTLRAPTNDPQSDAFHATMSAELDVIFAGALRASCQQN